MATKDNDANKRYGYRHRQVRARLHKVVEAGLATCWRCGKRIEPGSDWDLGHQQRGPDPNDPNGQRHAGPEHSACNRATYGRERPRAGVRLASHPDNSRAW